MLGMEQISAIQESRHFEVFCCLFSGYSSSKHLIKVKCTEWKASYSQSREHMQMQHICMYIEHQSSNLQMCISLSVCAFW